MEDEKKDVTNAGLDNTDGKERKGITQGFIRVLTRRKGVRKYPKNRKGVRAAMHDCATLKGHTRKSPARYKLHRPTFEELVAWSEWKAEQKAKKQEA